MQEEEEEEEEVEVVGEVEEVEEEEEEEDGQSWQRRGDDRAICQTIVPRCFSRRRFLLSRHLAFCVRRAKTGRRPTAIDA